MPDLVAKVLVVSTSTSATFSLWTEGVDRWWPKGHTRSKNPGTTVVLEGRVGGRFFERAPDGTEHEFGRVTLYDPPARLTYDWYLGSSIDQPTEVDIRFVDTEDGGTRIDIEHRGPELVGPLWDRTSPGYDRAWDAVLASFEKEL